MAVHDRGMLLIFARTDTERFERIWKTATALLFFYGRVAFVHENFEESKGGNAPSVLVAFGIDDAKVLEESGLRGAFVGGWRA